MIINLSDEDHLALGNNKDLVTKRADTFLVMGARAFEDVLSRNVVAITLDKSLKVHTFVGDSTARCAFSTGIYTRGCHWDSRLCSA
jgi:hypothetical protein